MFRFTIRELILLTLAVAMGIGWWMERSRLAHELDSIYRNPFLPSLPTWLFGYTNGPRKASPDEN